MARPNPKKSQFVPAKSAKKTTSPGSASRKAGRNVGSYSMEVDPVGLRVIGGKFRGSKLSYLGDRRLRPMKDRVREAAFNLIHSYVEGSFVLDLFGGTGALGLEALSRGAVGAVFTEQHFPTVRIIRQNIAALGLEAQTQVFAGDVFLHYKKEQALPKDHPWLIFCSPPYFFFKESTASLTSFSETSSFSAMSEIATCVPETNKSDSIIFVNFSEFFISVIP